MASDVNELTVSYEQDGLCLVKELDKVILTKGAWTTIMFKYQELNRSTEEYGPVRFTIRRYRKIKGDYRQQSKFNISSKDQAHKIIQALQNWLSEEEE
jgi:hypothetical protein